MAFVEVKSKRRKVKGLAFGVLLLFSMACHAQTFSEWFDQKNTQKKYLLQQVAALQSYAAVLKTGYRIATNGLGSIGGSAQSEFQLHNRYYAGLKTTSPSVKNSSQVRDILQWQADINTVFSQLRADPYYEKVKTAVLKDCSQQLTELQKLVSDNNLGMSDSERLKRIAGIHASMLSNYRFAVRFYNQAALIGRVKISQPKEIQTLKNLYGIR